MNLIADLTTMSLHRALDGLDRRQAAIADNVANIETAGFQARQVSFEDSLRAAIQGGTPLAAAITESRSLAPTRLNGNNVNLDNQIMANAENSLRQQLVIQGLNAKYQLLRTSITGR